MIYFDHNATTAVSAAVLAAMEPFFGRFHANPSALYRAGRLARTAIDQARAQVAALVNVEPSQVIFTSGGTEANHLALNRLQSLPSLAWSAVEHPSLSEPAERWGRCGKFVYRLPVDDQGRVEATFPAELDAVPPGLLSLMRANNETGVLQPLPALARAFSVKGWLIHTDAVQAAGKISVDFKQLGVNALSLSGHKLQGPKGVGALIVDQVEHWPPLLLGGRQEFGRRAGTENVPAIVGFGKAAELARSDLDRRQAALTELRFRLEQKLRALSEDVVIFSEQADRLPNTLQFALPGFDGEWLQMRLDKAHIAVSSGSACASGGGLPSPVLTAMGVSQDLARAAVRVSLGPDNQAEEIDRFVAELGVILAESQRR